MLAASVACAGCVSNSQHASFMPGVELGTYGNFHVVQEPEDTRDVGQAIADDLLSRNLNASLGSEADSDKLTDVLVFYDTKWHWDMTSYLWSLNIRFRDAASNLPLATATSEHSSLSRRSKKGMVREVLDNIFAGDVRDESGYYRPILADSLRVDITARDRPLPIGADVRGYGVQMVSDEELRAALVSSLTRNQVFESVSDDGDYLLTVTLNSLEADYTMLIVSVSTRNVATTATWTLTKAGTRELIYSEELVSVCNEDEMGRYFRVSDMAACSIRENLKAGLSQLQALELSLDD